MGTFRFAVERDPDTGLLVGYASWRGREASGEGIGAALVGSQERATAATLYRQ